MENQLAYKNLATDFWHNVRFISAFLELALSQKCLGINLVFMGFLNAKLCYLRAPY